MHVTLTPISDSPASSVACMVPVLPMATDGDNQQQIKHTQTQRTNPFYAIITTYKIL